MLIFHLILQVLTSAQAHDFNQTSQVQLLNQQLFQQKHIGSTNQSWFILFYRPTCPHCQHVMPTWEELANQTDSNITQIAAVNCNTNSDLASLFKISGVPTMILISQNGNLYRYNGDRSLPSFQQYILKNWNNTEIEEESNNQFFEELGNPQFIAILLVILLIGLLIYLCFQKDTNTYQPVFQDQQQRQLEMSEFQQINQADNI